MLPESPRQTLALRMLVLGLENANRLSRQESGLGNSPPLEKERTRVTNDVDNSKNSCQDSEADEETSPGFDEQKIGACSNSK